MTRIVTALIRVYQYLVSPHLPRSCRFTPSCSTYAIEAIEAHGVVKGCVLSAWRIIRCNPFLHGGYDPVPPRHCMMDASGVLKGDRHE